MEIEAEERLRDLWDELIHAAQALQAPSAEFDRLVTLALEARELGPYVRKKEAGISDEVQEEAILPNGQHLWTDLPYLVQEFEDAWAKESMGYTAKEREICTPELSRCALWLFKQTFEVEKPLTPTQEGGDTEDTCSSTTEMLPACNAWLKYDKVRLKKLSAANFGLTSSLTEKGTQIKRFKDLHLYGNEQIAKMARACFEEAILTGFVMGLDIPGEEKYLEKFFGMLDAELAARDLKGSVGPEDVEINMAWADED
ncbi:hypothetical protein BDV23DRAFT_172196 [Aspergillus alliaceus]|uniref:Uncharacterized protein n=1 Tax=Petromyces alliaceus TaxID=209559 RepID=A0A5N7C9E9_PETAA|nr:hypothetical protein BDV23DRAFT_172196 [Aspergillus alliaceus]